MVDPLLGRFLGGGMAYLYLRNQRVDEEPGGYSPMASQRVRHN